MRALTSSPPMDLGAARPTGGLPQPLSRLTCLGPQEAPHLPKIWINILGRVHTHTERHSFGMRCITIHFNSSCVCKNSKEQNGSFSCFCFFKTEADFREPNPRLRGNSWAIHRRIRERLKMDSGFKDHEIK